MSKMSFSSFVSKDLELNPMPQFVETKTQDCNDDCLVINRRSRWMMLDHIYSVDDETDLGGSSLGLVSSSAASETGSVASSVAASVNSSVMTREELERRVQPVQYAFFGHALELESVLQASMYSQSYARQANPSPHFLEKALVAPALFAGARLAVWLPRKLLPFVHEELGEHVYHPDIHGLTQMMPFAPVDYAHPALVKTTKKYIRETMRALCAQNPELRVVGLGALNKAIFFSKNGEDFVEEADKLGIHLATGNSMTSAVVVQNMLRAVPVGGRIFVNGSTSNIGQAVISYLALRGYHITFHTKSVERAEALLEKVEAARRSCGDTVAVAGRFVKPVHTTEMSDIAEFEYVLLGSSADVCNLVREEAWCTSFAVPPPPQFPAKAEDRISGRQYPKVLRSAGVVCPQGMRKANQMYSPEGTTYACHVGTIVHAHNNWQHHEVGDIDPHCLDLLWEKAGEMGFSLMSEDDQ